MFLMRRIAIIAVSLILLASFAAECREGGQGSNSVPRVIYIKPYSQSMVDVSDGKPVVFEWAMLPIPSGTRFSYRFVLHKGSGYNLVHEEVVDPRTFSVQLPAEKFEPGAEYWWYVKQRDARTMVWSQYDIWYFRVLKK
jgi:hypothetical protein